MGMHLFRLLAVCLAFALLAPAAATASVPAASTGPAADVTGVSATLTGVVSPNKEVTTWAFEYGTTTAYGARTPDASVSGNAGKDVDAAITGLTPNTVYHFRLVASNASGSDVGADMTFTTASSAYTLPTLTIAAAPPTVRFGRPTVISGQLAGAGNAGVQVQLEQDPYPFDGSFKKTGQPVTTDAAGNYAFTVTPDVNTHYRAVAKASPPVTSAEVTVRVRSRVSFGVSDTRVKRGQRVRFKGTVTPAHDGRRVKIQRRTSTGFKTVAKALLRAASGGRSAYRTRLRIRNKATYRVLMPGHGDHAAGISRKRTIRVGA
jgi:hypothetical protein